MPSIEIRKAIPGDEVQIAEIGEVFFAEAGWHDVTQWNGDKAKDALAIFIEKPECVIYVAIEGHEIIGMIGAFITEVWFSDDLLGQELFWYMKPDKRSGTGHKLLKTLEKELMRRGVQLGSMFTVDKINGMSEYFARNGYRPSEHTYIRKF